MALPGRLYDPLRARPWNLQRLVLVAPRTKLFGVSVRMRHSDTLNEVPFLDSVQNWVFTTGATGKPAWRYLGEPS